MQGGARYCTFPTTTTTHPAYFSYAALHRHRRGHSTLNPDNVNPRRQARMLSYVVVAQSLGWSRGVVCAYSKEWAQTTTTKERAMQHIVENKHFQEAYREYWEGIK